MRLRLPESVYRFCTDERTASAVLLLLSGRSPRIPDGLQWDELEDFYRACLAAQQTRVEWAVALHQLWNAVFSDQVEGWKPSSMTKQAVDSGVDMSVDAMWEKSEYTRDFTKRGFILELQIELGSELGARANASLWKDDRVVPMELPQGGVMDNDWICSAWLPVDHDQELDLSGLRLAARAAMAAADRAISAAEGLIAVK